MHSDGSTKAQCRHRSRHPRPPRSFGVPLGTDLRGPLGRRGDRHRFLSRRLLEPEIRRKRVDEAGLHIGLEELRGHFRERMLHALRHRSPDRAENPDRRENPAWAMSTMDASKRGLAYLPFRLRTIRSRTIGLRTETSRRLRRVLGVFLHPSLCTRPCPKRHPPLRRREQAKDDSVLVTHRNGCPPYTEVSAHRIQKEAREDRFDP